MDSLSVDFVNLETKQFIISEFVICGHARFGLRPVLIMLLRNKLSERVIDFIFNIISRSGAIKQLLTDFSLFFGKINHRLLYDYQAVISFIFHHLLTPAFHVNGIISRIYHCRNKPLADHLKK